MNMLLHVQLCSCMGDAWESPPSAVSHLHKTGSSATSRQPHVLPLAQCTNTEPP